MLAGSTHSWMLWLKTEGCRHPAPQRTQAQVLLPLQPLNPHTRTRNSLRFSQIGALAKCNRQGAEKRVSTASASGEESEVGHRPKEEKPQLACLIWSLGLC